MADAAGQSTTQLRNRSYNMSQSANGYAEFLVLPAPINAPLPAWRKFSEMRQPIPSKLFVFIDEHPDVMLDAQFGNPVGIPGYPAIWWDMPADRHNQGACLSFADGHAERWRWKVSKAGAYAGKPPSAAETLALEQAARQSPRRAGAEVAANPIRIGANVWIGLDACVLPGVTIGEGSVIGARSVVVEDVPPYSVAVGNPARVIRKLEPPGLTEHA